MSITYEEALATLQAMFGEPWTRETLDKVLRHEKGHMENTCDRILNHGSQDPQLLIAKLSGPDPQLALDEQLARQLASGSRGGSKKSSAAVKNGRGTPTDLPDDFLRIPGFKHTSSSAAAGGSNQVMDDAQLARMLQDELFSEELARNPDFAHLARGRRRGAPPGTRRVSASNAGGPRPSAVDDGPNILEKISELGDGARKKLAMFATAFEAKLAGINKPEAGGRSSLQENGHIGAETRGLLDDDDGEEEIEFEVRKNK